MDPHAQALLQWIGPTLLTLFGAVACFALRAVYKSLERILQKNEAEHLKFIETQQQHSEQLHSALLRDTEIRRRQKEQEEHSNWQDGQLRKHGERLTRVETKIFP